MEQGDLDAFVFLGDYIYENPAGGATDPRARTTGQDFECETVEQYRERYAVYKADPLLQAAHALVPWVITWDDQGHAIREATPDGTILEERAYDAAGRLLRATNGAGESTSFGWSGQNLLATVVDPAGLETRYGDLGEHGHPRRIERGGIVEAVHVVERQTVESGAKLVTLKATAAVAGGGAAPA